MNEAHPLLHPRFSKSVVVVPSGCWIWCGTRAPNGYGRFWNERKQHGAHRFAYQLARGTIPSDLTIDHLCRTPACVNPWHMEAVTETENIRRGTSPTANNRRKTQCKRGHPLSEATVSARGWRRCRPCDALRERAYAKAEYWADPETARAKAREKYSRSKNGL